MFLLQRLRERGQLNDADARRAEEAQAAEPGRPLHEILLEKGIGNEARPLRAGRGVRPGIGGPVACTVEPETLAVMPIKLVHRKGLMPVSRNNGTLVVATGDPFDVYALDELQTLTGLDIQPVLASPREITRLIKNHFGVGGETVTALVQERAQTTSSCSRTSRPTTASWPRGPGSVGRQAGQRNPDRGRQRAGQRHSHRAGRERAAHPLPHRRPAADADAAAGDQPLPGGDHQPHQDHGPAEHRREAPAAGRPHQDARPGPRDRRPRLDHPDDPRRRHRHASARQGPHGLQPRQRRHAAGHVQDVQAADRPAARHRAGHRADRLRQDRRRSTRALNEIKDETTQDHHRRGPGRVPAARASARFRCTPRSA